MWNEIWVTAESEQVVRVLEKLKQAGILNKCKTFFDEDRCFYKVLVPAAETGAALEILAEM